MADVGMVIEGLIDYSIVDNESDAEDLFEEIKYDMVRGFFKKAGKTILDYEVDVYGIPEDNLPYDVSGYAECLEEIYGDYPFNETDLNEYARNVNYENSLASELAKFMNKKHLALGAARLIREDMQKGNIKAAADIMEEVSDLPRLQLVLKLGNIAAQLAIGENESELDD